MEIDSSAIIIPAIGCIPAKPETVYHIALALRVTF